jgi:hypothetical protein
LDPYIYDPETKEQYQKWRYSGSSHSKKFKTHNSLSKMLASVFWDRDVILLVDYLEKSAAIMPEYYIALHDKLKQQLISKRRGKLLK